MYVCIFVCIYVCIYACMYVCIYLSICLSIYRCIYVCMYVCMHAWMHGCMDGWRDGGVEGWMDVCIVFLQCGTRARAFLHPWGGLFHFQTQLPESHKKAKRTCRPVDGWYHGKVSCLQCIKLDFLKRPTCDKPLGSHSLRIIWQPTNRGTYCDTQKIRNGSVLALTSLRHMKK